MIRFSRFDICEGSLCLSACVIHVWIGWFVGVAIIRMMVRRILLVRRHCDESRSVLCFIAVIAVMRKHPVMTRMILPCSEESACSCDVVDVIRVSPGLCQIIAA